MSGSTSAAVFLDRDGTIIEDRGHLKLGTDVKLIAGALEALRALQQRYMLFIVTNQSGVGDQLLSAAEVAAVNAHLLDQLAAAGVRIAEVYVCPHSTGEGCRCRKPSPYFLLEAARRHRIDLQASFMVGDHPSDLECGRLAGATPIYVLTGHGQKHLDGVQTAAPLLSDLGAAADWILHRPAQGQPPLALAEAARILRGGGIVALPTETVYGLGANALDCNAVRKIFAAKGRPANDPLIVHIATLDQLSDVVATVPALAEPLFRQFWPGPLTLILPKHPKIPAEVTAGLDTVAVRMPAHPIALQLIRQAGCPIAAPSANPFGGISPTTAAHVAAQLGDRIDGIVDGGRCAVGVESTIFSVLTQPPAILRPGGVSSEAIATALAAATISTRPATGTTPGSFASHYAPQARVVLCRNINDVTISPDRKVAYLRFREPVPPGQLGLTLSRAGNLSEAAQRLYAALHQLDALHPELIIAELVPDSGIGTAINDRLQRAAGERADATS